MCNLFYNVSGLFFSLPLSCIAQFWCTRVPLWQPAVGVLLAIPWPAEPAHGNVEQEQEHRGESYNTLDQGMTSFSIW